MPRPLTRKEMRAYHDALAPMLVWLGRAQKRLDERGEQETRDLTARAYDAIHALRVHWHYQSVNGAAQVNDGE
jgi:hypothetical protein